ncbi:hypothetical protein F2Q68_00034895 [Brassica cretica]|uniref:Uncharacterized protein n=1 Tax=Brassica cretica TaxID=69181 RepID=A0A8S9H349_BRACR|nr:hypothetical protein F2Q68_00034895 [Brassica cretica]
MNFSGGLPCALPAGFLGELPVGFLDKLPAGFSIVVLCTESVVCGLASHTSRSNSPVAHPSFFPLQEKTKFMFVSFVSHLVFFSFIVVEIFFPVLSKNSGRIPLKESSHHLKIITEGSPLLATIGAVMLHRMRALPSCLVPCHPVHGVDALYMVRRKQSWDVGAHDPPLRFLAEKVYCIHFMFLALQESLQNWEPRPKCKTLGFLVVKSSCLVFDLLSGSPILAKVRAIPSNPVLV